MAYNAKQLTRISYGAASDTGPGNASPLFMYRTTESLATILGANFFLAAYERLQKGSVLIAVTGAGGTPVATVLVVTTATAASVVLAKETDPGGVTGGQAHIAALGNTDAVLTTSGGNTYSDAAVKAAIDGSIDAVQAKLDALIAAVEASGLTASS